MSASRSVTPAEAWVRSVLRAHGIQLVSWGDDSVGMLNVPGKWCSLVADLTSGLIALEAGEPLPKLVAPEPKKKRGAR